MTGSNRASRHSTCRPSRGADPEEAARLIIALASGRADRLSGRHLSVTDSLDELLPQFDQIERADLHTLRLRTGR